MDDYTKIHLHPRATTSENNDGTVRIELMIPRLEPTKDKFNPKHGEVSLTWFNDGFGFSVKVKITDKKAKTKLKYVHKVDKMPTRINRKASKWTVEKGKLVLNLVKDVAESWSETFLSNGLDQASSSDSE